jgi:hypothetical protein
MFRQRLMAFCSKATFLKHLTLIALAFSFAAAFSGRAVLGQGTPSSDVVAIEEDWEFVVGEPDPAALAPQTTCVFSPIQNTDLLYAAVDFNHHSQFEFASGGVQLQVWTNNYAIATAESSANGRLCHEDEHLNWTQKMSVADGNLTFEVLNGQSETWGAFGGNGELAVQVGTSLTNLNDYSPDVSVQNSGIGFASNRVKSLVLKRVRATLSNGDVVEDNTERVVFYHD